MTMNMVLTNDAGRASFTSASLADAISKAEEWVTSLAPGSVFLGAISALEALGIDKGSIEGRVFCIVALEALEKKYPAGVPTFEGKIRA